MLKHSKLLLLFVISLGFANNNFAFNPDTFETKISNISNLDTNHQAQKKVPIIFSTKYDVTLWGIQKFHPFDSEKYSKAYKYLKKHYLLDYDDFYHPEAVSDSILLTVHSSEYLEALKQSKTVAQIAEIPPLKYLPTGFLKRRILKPMRLATGGSLLGVDVALKEGYAINLSGGYHHARSNFGGGFCFFADVNLAAQKYLQLHPKGKVLILDLDAHQGDGHASITKHDPRIIIMDVYNQDVYPNDSLCKTYIDFHHPVSSGITDEPYLEIVKKGLEEVIQKAKPTFILYVAGTDIYQGDRLGRMDISFEGVVKRDEMVFEISNQNHIPILMMLSGGYTKTSSQIIGHSVGNILLKMDYFKK